jgi:hypothetical protein
VGRLHSRWRQPYNSMLLSTLPCRFAITYVLLLPCRLPGARKRLAVPFRAADTPDPRSEFAQPDIALMYTILRYVQDIRCYTVP